MDIKNTGFETAYRLRENLLNKNTLDRIPGKTHNEKLFTEQSFRDILISKTAGEEGAKTLKFSKHANQRLASRNINLSDEQMARLSEGTDRARRKGINESLIMVDELAFIVNVKNNTVVTAVEGGEEKIFTNIDGAVIG